MNRWKQNSSSWYVLGLGLLLCLTFLVTSTGTTFARYRKERMSEIHFEVQELENIYLGIWKIVGEEGATSGETVFMPKDFLEWETIDAGSRLHMTIANGTSETEYSQQDQKVTLRLLGTLAVFNGEEAVKIYLHYPSSQENGETEKLQAVATPIQKDTVLYHTHGPGWIYSFQIPEGELSWVLPGEKFSTIDLMLTTEGEILRESASLQPEVSAKIIME